MFDAGVKSFVKNILLGGKVPIVYFSHRVEFQARGLPHIHGVCWIDKGFLSERGINGDLMDNEEAAVILADELVSCHLPDLEEKPLGDIVRQVQIHKHTKSCKKYNGICRYGFAKLPCPKTLIAKPIEVIYPDMDEKDRKSLKAKAEKVLGLAKKLMNEEGFNDKMSHKDFCKILGVSEEEYIKYMEISQQGEILILKRICNEGFVNNYIQPRDAYSLECKHGLATNG